MTDRSQIAAATTPPLDLTIALGVATDVGGRASNEDAVHAAELPALPPVAGGTSGSTGGQTFLLAVADGMGGHADGEVASRLAIEALVAAVGNEPGPDAGLMFKQAYRRANDAIRTAGGDDSRRAGSGADAERPMGTTLVAALVRGKYATIANVGDSRAYLLRAGTLNQITEDHTLLAEEVASGAVKPKQARANPRRHVLTHALGIDARLDSRLPSVFELTLLPEDRLLLCSDGFTDVLDDRQMAAVLRELPAEEAAIGLVALANKRGTTDNVTAIVAAAMPTRVAAVVTQPAPAPRGGLAIQSVVLIVAVLLIVLAAAGLFVFGWF